MRAVVISGKWNLRTVTVEVSLCSDPGAPPPGAWPREAQQDRQLPARGRECPASAESEQGGRLQAATAGAGPGGTDPAGRAEPRWPGARTLAQQLHGRGGGDYAPILNLRRQI